MLLLDRFVVGVPSLFYSCLPSFLQLLNLSNLLACTRFRGAIMLYVCSDCSSIVVRCFFFHCCRCRCFFFSNNSNYNNVVLVVEGS